MEVKDLIIGCKNDDRRSQKALVDTFAPYLFAISKRYMRDESEAKDIIQEAFISIFNNIQNFRSEPYAFKAWMRQITVNTALQKIRKSYRTKEVMPETMMDDRNEMPEIYQKFDVDDIMKIINQLPDKYRQVFNMYVIDGYSHREIGDELGLKESSSRALLTRAKVKIKEKLFEIQKMAI